MTKETREIKNYEERREERNRKIKRIQSFYRTMLETDDVAYSIKVAEQIAGMQCEDGSWSVVETRHGDGDYIVEFVFFPTYYATAALMRCSLLAGKLPEHVENAFHCGLAFAQGRKLCGHGYDATAERLKALSIYKRAGLYDWMTMEKNSETEFCTMIQDIIEGFRTAVLTGHTFSDWSRDFRKEFEQEVAEYDENMYPYVWYAAYGSNLCRERFMEYIESCSDKSSPEEERPYQIPYELYFAYSSHRWNRSGVAFIDGSKPGNTMGKVYKIRRSQFREIHRLEGSPYSNKIALGMLDGIPVYSFTSPERRYDVKAPCREYLDVILAGLKETYPDKGEIVHQFYLFAHGALNEDDIKILSFLRNAAHGQSVSQISERRLAITRVKKSIKTLYSLGLIKQDSRSVASGHTISSPEAVFYTVKEKRELIDTLLIVMEK